jgi:hypothetical protein
VPPSATSAPGLDTALPYLHRDWARASCIYAVGLGSPAPHLRRDCAHPGQVCPLRPCARRSGA